MTIWSFAVSSLLKRRGKNKQIELNSDDEIICRKLCRIIAFPLRCCENMFLFVLYCFLNLISFPNQ